MFFHFQWFFMDSMLITSAFTVLEREDDCSEDVFHFKKFSIEIIKINMITINEHITNDFFTKNTSLKIHSMSSINLKQGIKSYPMLVGDNFEDGELMTSIYLAQ